MSSWQAILLEFGKAQTLWLGLLFLFTYPFVGIETRAGRRRHGWSSNLALLAHLVLVPITAVLSLQGIRDLARLTHLGYQLSGLFVLTVIVVRLIHQRLLPHFGLQPPRIAHDLAISLITLMGLFGFAAQVGLNLTGVIATSAVLTAVIGLALQDTLGNVIGGMVLQLDKSFAVGDWVKFGDVSGRVSEISWRYTTIETRNWETVIVPNSQLMKNQLTVLGKRLDASVRWRRWVWFHVDFRYSPSEVIQVVTQALLSADIPLVAADPPPNCILMDFSDSTGRYAVRYWLTDPAVDDPTDSAIRVHLAYALKRAGIPISLPAQTLFLNRGEPGQRGRISEKELGKRTRLLSQIHLFEGLTGEEHKHLAEKLITAPFLKGEVITRQGAEGHWLYILAEGTVSIRLQRDGIETEVNQLHAIDFFGEMSLMTGEPRGSTVAALSDVLCYRLDKESFQEILQQRPAIAEYIAEILAGRKAQTSLASDLLAHDHLPAKVQSHNILESIRTFFRLDDLAGV